VKGEFFVLTLKAIRRIIKGHLGNPLLVIPVAKVKVEPTMPALHLVAPSVARVFGEKLKVDGTINEVSPFFSLAEKVYRGYWMNAKENLTLLMENVTERLRPILEEEKPELLRAVRRVGKTLLDRLSERIVSRYWVERTLRELAEALDQAYCEAFRIVKGVRSPSSPEAPAEAEIMEELLAALPPDWRVERVQRVGVIRPRLRAVISKPIPILPRVRSSSNLSRQEDPYLDYIEELKRYKISTFHSLRAHRYTEMIKALPDFEPVPYYTYEVEPATLREALGWIDRESFQTLLAYRIIYKDDVWRVKERLTLPEFTTLSSIAEKHDIKVEVVEEAR